MDIVQWLTVICSSALWFGCLHVLLCKGCREDEEKSSSVEGRAEDSLLEILSHNNLPSVLFDLIDLYSNYDPYEYSDSRNENIVQK